MKEVTIKHKETIKKYLKTVGEPIADLTFTMRFIWAEQLKHLWTIINGNLCFFGFFQNRYALWGPPIGGNEILNTINECFDIAGELNQKAGINKSPLAVYTPGWLKDNFGHILSKNGYKFTYWTQDYVYKVNELIELKGSKYKDKRNLLNTFARNGNIYTDEFNCKAHVKECLELIDKWKCQKDKAIEDSTIKDNYKHSLNSETEAAKKLIKFSNKLDIKGIVLRADGKIIGVSIGEPLNNLVYSNIIEKTDLRFKGASAFIFREFAKHFASYQFINAQDDFGIDYLKKVKMSYNPARLLKIYILKKAN